MTNLAVILLRFMRKGFCVFFSVLLIITVLISCKTTGHSEKYYEKQEKEKAAREQKEYDAKVEGHKKIQSKSTQKMMKETEKQAKKLNKSKKPKLKKC
jgi:hypothetical protein